MMETEEDAYVFEREEDIMESESEEEDTTESESESESGEEEEEEDEDIMESESEEEEEEEEAEQLEEMKPPVFTSWTGPDGITVDGIMCIDDGIIRLKNRCQLDDCSICYKPASTTHPRHQICCLPCGHMYGFSCIKIWLLLSSPSGKCPQCNSLCTIQDALLLYPQPLCVTAHQQQSPLTAFFPLTQQGFLEFKEYETSRALDALRLQAHDLTHFNILVKKHNGLVLRVHELTRQSDKLLTHAKDIEEWPESSSEVDALLQAHDLTHFNIFVTKHNHLVLRAHELTRQSDNLLTQAEELEERPESLGLADALRRQARLLEPRIDALIRRIDALGWRTDALKRRSDAFGQRSDASRSRLEFFAQMYREHALTKKNNNEPFTTCMEKKDKKKMQASSTVEVPKEEPLEDIAEEHEEEKVEEKAKPTTGSRSNKGKGSDSISKVILKRK